MIKLMLMDAEYADIPEDIRGNVFSSGAARRIHEGIVALDDGKRPMDRNRLIDALDESDARQLAEIEKKFIPAGKDREIFNDCMEQVRRSYLKKQEEEIITKLSMADEEENHDEIIRLTQQLIDIQKKIKK